MSEREKRGRRADDENGGGPRIERRYVDLDELRTIRADGEDDEGPKIVGHAAVFDRETVIWSFFGEFREKIARGAFKRSITRDDIRALWNHDSSIVLGRNKAGTLELAEDEVGLRSEISPPNWAESYLETIERGDVSQMSFAFLVEKEDFEKGADGELDLRTITRAKLFDVSPVTYPAYEDTDVGVRSSSEVDARTYEAWRESRGEPVARREEPAEEADGEQLASADAVREHLTRRQQLAELEL